MTPLLPHPDDYLFNLIAMTSPEAKRLWRRAIKDYFQNQCVYCGETYATTELTLDHVYPKAKGGETVTRNLVPACKCCNQDKGTQDWKNWMRSRFGFTHREQLITQHIN